MKILLVSINSRFIHTNLAIRSLRAYCSKIAPNIEVEIGEWNINQPASEILQNIYRRNCDVILFSVYIWNVLQTFAIARDLKKIMPNSFIGFGGPEVSYRADSILKENSWLDLIICGEGEVSFSELAQMLEKDFNRIVVKKNKNNLKEIKGLYFFNEKNEVIFTGNRNPIAKLDDIPFPYGLTFNGQNDDPDSENQFIYYESSRGCPFSCAYCLSSIDRGVRHLSLERVKSDLSFFMKKQYKIVKFVDRTFNLVPKHYLGIWNFIKENWNRKTIFHFEIAGGILPEEAFDLLKEMPEGSIQFEVGVQSSNLETLKAVNRIPDLETLSKNLKKIPKNIPVHLDLIAGLPYEDFKSFGQSFDFTFSFFPQMLQLGFLKVLYGSQMLDIANKMNFVWSEIPPYEILSTPCVSYEEMSLLKKIDKVVDMFYNSGRFVHIMQVVFQKEKSAFMFFCELAKWMDEKIEPKTGFRLLETPKRPSEQFSILFDFFNETNRVSDEWLETLRFDFLLNGKPGQYPNWFEHRYTKDAHDEALTVVLKSEINRRLGFSLTEYDTFYWLPKDDRLEISGGKKIWKILFVYENSKSISLKSKKTENINDKVSEKTEKDICKLLEKKLFVI